MKYSVLQKNFYQQLKNDYSGTEIEMMFDLLTQKYLGKNVSEVGRTGEIILEEEQKKRFEDAILRLKKFEPIQYVLGEINFFGRPFKVNSHVHVPRPETETLINWVLEDFPKLRSQGNPVSLLDIGTGCGVIPVTLAKELPQLKVSAMDISTEALQIAKENTKRNNAEIEFIQKNVLETDKLPRNFDFIVSNPPYVREGARQDVQRKILDFEPAVALYVKDDDPMIFNRKIAELAKNFLSPNGIVYVEINMYLATETRQVFEENGFKTELRKDVFGNNRTVKAFREN